jgi:hypothetical protein
MILIPPLAGSSVSLDPSTKLRVVSLSNHKARDGESRRWRDRTGASHMVHSWRPIGVFYQERRRCSFSVASIPPLAGPPVFLQALALNPIDQARCSELSRRADFKLPMTDHCLPITYNDPRCSCEWIVVFPQFFPSCGKVRFLLNT